MTKSEDVQPQGGESGQLSESGESRTFDPNAQPDPTKPNTSGSISDDPGKHGRPTDDTDPGHS